MTGSATPVRGGERGRMGARLRAYVGEAFAAAGGVGWAILGLFVAVNGIVLYNAIFHPPTIGYDGGAHLRYIAILAEGRLPSPAESAEFFSPPLAYVVPAAAMALADLDLARAAKVGQLAQFLLSVVLTFFLLKVCDLLRPRDATMKVAALAMCAMPAVYHKTFAQIRGEPWLALAAVLVVFLVLRALRAGKIDARHGLALGAVCGLGLLARQWAALLMIGVAVFGVLLAVRRPSWRWPITRAAAVATGVAFIIGAWFYLSLLGRFGSVTTFALGDAQGVEVFDGPRGVFSLSAPPREFLLGTGNGKLFTAPVRNSFPNQLGPIFYSEAWGDYWMFFVLHGRDGRGRCLNGPRLERELARGRSEVESNYATASAYLGRVNASAMLPTAVMLVGLAVGAGALARTLVGRGVDDRAAGLALLCLLVVASLAGYLWFVVAHYDPGSGATIKATYMLQVFPLLAVLGAETLTRLRARSRGWFLVLAAALSLVALHNAPALLTRYASWVDPVCGRGRALPRVTRDPGAPVPAARPRLSSTEAT